MYSIYKVVNTVNNKVYIGFTSFPVEKRWQEHIYSSKYTDCKFYRAIRKYGKENFIVNTVYQTEDKDHALSVEVLLIAENDSFVNGYNSTSGGDNYIYSEETRKLMSIGVRKYYSTTTYEIRRKIAISRRKNWKVIVKGQVFYTSDLPMFCKENNINYRTLKSARGIKKENIQLEEIKSSNNS